MNKGGWNKSAGKKCYLTKNDAQELLCAGGWPGAANNLPQMCYWHERLMIDVPEELIHYMGGPLKSIEEYVSDVLPLLVIPER